MTTPEKPLRLWPCVALAVMYLLLWLVLPKIWPDQGMYWFFGMMGCGAGILLWWIFFSRAPWRERLGFLLLMGVALFATSRILHPSIAGAGMGMLFIFYATPMMFLAFGLAVVAANRLASGPRRAVVAAVILLASGGWALVRTDGIRAAGGLDFAWRWSLTPEEKLLAQAGSMPPAPAAVAATAAKQPAPAGEAAALPAAPELRAPEKQPAASADKNAATPAAPSAVRSAGEWPGFRGPERNSIVHGVRIETNWTSSPPAVLWRRPIGPGWSSFAVHGDRIYTQEQRGEEEVVACYSAKTGEPVWMHRDATRFWEANAGAGPRATPTLASGRVYTFGATGMVNALDAATGAVVWSRNATTDTGAKAPYWGFASSPLVVGDVVIVYAGALVAYDAATGAPRWKGPEGGVSYSSPHMVTLDGVPQVVLLAKGATSFAPADGKVLWKHEWPGSTMVQPGLTPEGDILISDVGIGTRRLAVTQGPNGWTVTERWTSIRLKPYFNDFVVHRGHAFGFDGAILACMDLKDGERKWKGGRYGNGQLVLLADEDLLVVLSEDGELALVKATPDQFTELARIPAIEGKTWNHPVLVGDLLLVRNDHEMAAFRLSLVGTRSSR